MNQGQEAELFWQPVLHAYMTGKGALPLNLGLEAEQFIQFTRELGHSFDTTPGEMPFYAKRELLQNLAALRIDEAEQLRQLLTRHADAQRGYSKQAIQVITMACLGSNHLWSDLGLPERPRLSAMIEYYFPQLYTKNQHNMRWKRFFYRQLCEEGGDYVCRSPSCETCTSYSECFVEQVKV
jgi:nitrogen fixation protein NifQ